MRYCSTRNNEISKTASQAVVKGISDDGGLFVPQSLLKVNIEDIISLADKPYYEAAAFILKELFDDIPEETLKQLAKASYGDNFAREPAPLIKLDDRLFSLELWHGPTSAFKDMALQFMPRLFVESKRINGVSKQSLILVATSGDTGKAALEGFRDVDGVSVMVFYPRFGVSGIQRLQMTTQKGGNVFVAGIDGNFDDAQRAVKNLMTDRQVISMLDEGNIEFSSANSINWGRLAPQIVYYFTSYAKLVKNGEIKKGDMINFAVPSGNFGNILAGYYAKEMGLPIDKLICASNKNDVLADFINTGLYVTDRVFYTTISPSMDILVSSNVERLVWQLTGQDSSRTKSLYESLRDNREFVLNKDEIEKLQGSFNGYFCDDFTTKAQIKDVYEQFGYLCDPHTAVAFDAAQKHKAFRRDDTPTVVISTASPYKFAGSVLSALGEENIDGFAALDKLSALTKTEIPANLIAMKEDTVRFDNCYEKTESKAALLDFVKTIRQV